MAGILLINYILVKKGNKRRKKLEKRSQINTFYWNAVMMNHVAQWAGWPLAQLVGWPNRKKLFKNIKRLFRYFLIGLAARTAFEPYTAVISIPLECINKLKMKNLRAKIEKRYWAQKVWRRTGQNWRQKSHIFFNGCLDWSFLYHIRLCYIEKSIS